MILGGVLGKLDRVRPGLYDLAKISSSGKGKTTAVGPSSGISKCRSAAVMEVECTQQSPVLKSKKTGHMGRPAYI